LATQSFRANVGVVLVNSNGMVLALERCDIKYAWQMPQGGLDEGEEPLDCAWRELYEEINLTKQQAEMLRESPTWLAYELPKEARKPKTGRGQVQKWFLFQFAGVDSDIDLSPAHPGDEQEFCNWKWTTLRQLASETWEVRRHIYEQLITHFSSYLTE